MPKPDRPPREQLERALHVSFKLPAEATAGTDALQLIQDLADPDPCEYDHHGYCQAHMRFTDDRPCPHRRAQQYITAHTPKDHT